MTDLRPIFVVGPARGGTTLLQSALGAHHRIAAPPELYFVARIASLSDYYGDLESDDRLALAVEETVAFALWEPLGIDRSAALDRARGGPRTMAGVMSAVMDELAHSWGKARWSDKSPWQGPGDVVALFPDAAFVHIVRDPRDVIASSRQAPWIDESALELASKWRRFHGHAVQFGTNAGPRSYLQIRYEDLVADPEPVLRMVCTFLEENFDPAMLDPSSRGSSGTVVPVAAPWQDRVGGQIDASSVGRWRSGLDRRERCLVQAELASALAGSGYETPRFRSRIAGRLLRPTELPNDLVRLSRYLQMRRRLAPAQRHTVIRAMADRAAPEAGAGDRSELENRR